MSADMILAIVGSGGVGAVLVAIVTGLFSKKRLSAEATEVITKAASGMIDNLREDNRSVRESAAQLARRVTELERRNEVLERVLELHEKWDRDVIAKLRSQGIDVPNPPPLRAPEN